MNNGLTRYFIYLSYDGSAYKGWQVQPGAITIQGTLNKALSLILGEEICVTGAGRTDTGVHAQKYCAHFDSKLNTLAEDDNLIFRLNRYLPSDIAIGSIKLVIPDANARYSAIARTYKYFISSKKDPFLNKNSWFIYGNLDIEAMNRACNILYEHSDFTSFSKLHSGSKTNVCRIYQAGWETTDTGLIFTIKADRFLRNMVRAIVGTMTDIGFGKLSCEKFSSIILAKDRCMAGMSAPARGLFLCDIEYPEELFI